MPIYMDRHNVSDTVTAEHVARLHQEDLKVQDQFGCRGLTYWFDEKRKTAFCLIEAPNEQALKDMHDKAHGDVPYSVIEVDAGIVESFLGRIEDPENAQDAELNIISDPAFRTIMVSSLNDLFIKQNGNTALRASLVEFYDSILKALTAYEGKLVRQTEDQFLVSFTSVSKAVYASLDIHALFKKFSADIKSEHVKLKIGLSTGVPVTEKKSIFEDSIKLAERMCSVINGEIILSSEVKDLFRSENANGIPGGDHLVSLSNNDERFLTQLMDYTETTWRNVNLKVEDFCKPLGCSKSQLYRKLMMFTGKSPNGFIKEYRLKEAVKLLNKNSGNISEIAFETGFSSPSYFSKCFQKRFGQIPSDYLLAQPAN